MKSSIFAAVTGAALALANPLDKRVLETEVVVEYYTVTVTGNGPAPTTTATPTTTVVKATPSNIKVRPHTKPAQQDPPVEQPEHTSPTVIIVTVTPEATPEPKPTTAVQVPATTAQDKPAETTIAEPSDNGFESTALYHHNIHRSNHSSPEMSWNGEIAGYAANTAATCHFAHDMYVIADIIYTFLPANLFVGTRAEEVTARTLPFGV